MRAWKLLWVIPEETLLGWVSAHPLATLVVIFLGGCDHRTREEMHNETIHLKRDLQTQNYKKMQMKAKLQRLGEDNTKRETDL